MERTSVGQLAAIRLAASASPGLAWDPFWPGPCATHMPSPSPAFPNLQPAFLECQLLCRAGEGAPGGGGETWGVTGSPPKGQVGTC